MTKLASTIQPTPIPRDREQRYPRAGKYFTPAGMVSVGTPALSVVDDGYAPLSEAERLRFKAWLNDWSIGRDAADQICASRIFDQLGA